MNYLDARRELAREIRDAIAGDDAATPESSARLSATVANRWRGEPPQKPEPLLEMAYHSLLHYLSDRDIRVRDLSYAAKQTRDLERLATRLETESK